MEEEKNGLKKTDQSKKIYQIFLMAILKPNDPDENIRTYLNYVSNSVNNRQRSTILVDVRIPQEFSGEITAPPEYPTEHAQRGGHIPGAVNIPWAKAVNEDGTFKSARRIKKLVSTEGITPEKEIIYIL